MGAGTQRIPAEVAVIILTEERKAAPRNGCSSQEIGFLRTKCNGADLGSGSFCACGSDGCHFQPRLSAAARETTTWPEKLSDWRDVRAGIGVEEHTGS